MPRKKIIYNDLYPYHIYARSNNREWFYIRTDILWELFVVELNKLVKEHNFQIFAFVLMNNHYHLLAGCHADHPLPVVMHKLQMRMSRNINKIAGRINHIFGGPYRATRICSANHFSTCFKYVLRNPVKANICEKVENYQFSTFCMGEVRPEIHTSCSNLSFDLLNKNKLNDWLNIPFSNEQNEIIRKAIKKTEFKYSKRDTNKI